MMSADHSLIPFALPTKDDLGIDLGLGEGHPSAVGLRRQSQQAAMMLFLWLLASGILAMTAVYHVVADGPGARLLSWTASAGAVALLLGALVLKQRRWSLVRQAQSQEISAHLLLTAFIPPTAQLLLTLVISQDLSYSIYVMLLVTAYALLANTTEALLLYVTITLAAWCACALRCPAGAWVGYTLPWAGTVGLSLLVHLRSQRQSLAAPATRPLSSSSIIEVNLEEPLRAAIAERDKVQAASKLLEQELTAQCQARSVQSELLHLVEELTQQLAQDTTLQEIGPRWLDRLIYPLRAEYAAIWLKEKDQAPRQAVSTSATASSDETLVGDAFQTGTLLHRDQHWAVPLDLGLHGRGVLLIQGVHSHDNTATDKLLRTAASLLSVFMRWHLAEAENDAIHHDIHQHRERSQRLQDELQAQQLTHQQLHDHLRTQWQKAEQQLIQLQAQSTTTSNQTEFWKVEAERYQKLVETAQNEHDTLSQLLEEAESELKKKNSIPDNSSLLNDYEAKQKTLQRELDLAKAACVKLEQKSQASEAERAAAEAQWDSAEKELQKIRTALTKAESEAAEAHAEWERETELVNRLSTACKAIPDALAVFDIAGKVIVENEAARLLRGSTRNLTGEHPLYQQLITKDRLNQKKPWVSDWQSADVAYQVVITPIIHQNQIDGYVITAGTRQQAVPVDETTLAGPRFFGGLAQTLEPPLSLLIDHADSLFDSNSDQDIRRQALVGILQQGRHVRRLLTQAVDYAQLEAGQAAIVKSPASPWQLLQQIVNQLRPSAEEKGLELTLQPAGSLPVSITTDPHRLTGLLQQLISQAIRHTGTGPIVVKMGLDQQKAGSYAASKLRVDISSDARLPTNTFAADFAFNLARKQAGILHAELNQQATSTSLALPVSSSEMLHLLPAERLKLDEDSLPGAAWLQPLRGKVLVVCDGQEQQRVTAYQLERLGLRCEVLADAEQALVRASEDRFDLVLWDAAKRDLPLTKACQHLRSQFYQGAILAVGTLASPSQREDFLAAGGDGFLSRPIVLAAWRHVISSYLPDGNTPLQAGGDALTSDFHADRDFFILVRGYVNKLPAQLAEMRAALQVADVARLIRLSHAMVDASQLYGYPVLSEQAQHLEKALLQGRDTALLTQLVDQLHHTMAAMERGIKLTRSSSYLALPGPLTRAA